MPRLLLVVDRRSRIVSAAAPIVAKRPLKTLELGSGLCGRAFH